MFLFLRTFYALSCSLNICRYVSVVYQHTHDASSWLFNQLFQLTSKIFSLCKGNPQVASGFLSQGLSNAAIFSIYTSSWLMYTIIKIICLANSCAIWQYDYFSSSLCNLASCLCDESAQCNEFLQPKMFSVNSHNDLAYNFHIQFIAKFTYYGRIAILIKSTSRVIGIYIIYGLIHWLLREGLGLGTKNF